MNANVDKNIYVLKYYYDDQQGYTLSNNDYLTQDNYYKIQKFAQPYGQKWFKYIGIESVKQFPISKEYLAISYSKISSQKDELGRTGILDTYVVVMPASQYNFLIAWNLRIYKTVIKQLINENMFINKYIPLSDFIRITSKIQVSISDISYYPEYYSPSTHPQIDKIINRIVKGKKVILTSSFQSNSTWHKIENYFNHVLLRLPYKIRSNISYTTFCLSNNESTQFFGIPSEEFATLNSFNKDDVFIIP
ncbi:MAG: hypothetical protein HZB92_05235 [Euryarchaeota archaeon]|nr:hypothetical protein [Euryarchaeota archaeon]